MHLEVHAAVIQPSHWNAFKADSAQKEAGVQESPLCSADGKLRHQKTKDAVTAITCPEVGDTGFPPWKCVMGSCLNCPKYPVPMFEDDISNDAPRINFTTSDKAGAHCMALAILVYIYANTV
jgi:hypothetical protein